MGGDGLCLSSCTCELSLASCALKACCISTWTVAVSLLFCTSSRGYQLLRSTPPALTNPCPESLYTLRFILPALSFQAHAGLCFIIDCAFKAAHQLLRWSVRSMAYRLVLAAVQLPLFCNRPPLSTLVPLLPHVWIHRHQG